MTRFAPAIAGASCARPKHGAVRLTLDEFQPVATHWNVNVHLD